MRILTVSDKDGSAIDRLDKMNVERLPHLQIAHLAVHPKRPEPAQLEAFRRLAREADLISFSYWKTAVMLRKACPEIESKPMVLTHHNEQNVVGEWEWMDMKWSAHVVKNGWQRQQLVARGYDPVLIRHAADIEALPFTPKLTDEKVVGYCGQVKKVKGIREIKQACDALGYRLMVVTNRISEAAYFVEMDKNGMLILQDVPDAEMGATYAKMRVYCANSDDGTESGTLPILEAMAAGIPVVTREIGLVRDCGADGKNMVIRKGAMTDIEDLKNALQLVVENDDVANELRENAWRTVRQYHPEVQAREYEKLWKKVLFPGETSVSVIIPTYNRADILAEKLASLDDQAYDNFEVVVADDGSTDGTAAVVDEARKRYRFPVRHVEAGRCASPLGHEAHAVTKDYGLARARNLAVIEAIGEVVVFADDRLKPHPASISAFVKKLKSIDSRKSWCWGAKGGVFKSFVENWSATWRRSLIDGGMFNERMDEYGGTTQEISARFGAQGFKFEFCPESACEVLMGTHSRSNKRLEIVRSKIRLYKMGLQ